MRVRDIAIRVGLLALAALVALAGAEAVVRGVVGYPPRPATRIFFISDKLGTFGRLHWSVPNARFWNVEAGNRVFRYNNLGLPGCDVHVAPGTPCVFLMGSSWVEALQVDADRTASSVLQARLAGEGSPLQVLNLGASGADPYISWLRSRFFAGRFQPHAVVLVLEEFHGRWMGRHPQPLDFTLAARFGAEEARTGPRQLLARLREGSAFANLVANGREGRPEAATRPAVAADTARAGAAPRAPERLPANLQEVLRHFHRDYGDRFLLFSVLVDPEQKRELEAFCRTEGLHWVAAPEVMDPENRFNGTGHLNERGNRELGRALHAAIVAPRPEP